MYMADNQHLTILRLQVMASMMESDLKFLLTDSEVFISL